MPPGFLPLGRAIPQNPGEAHPRRLPLRRQCAERAGVSIPRRASHSNRPGRVQAQPPSCAKVQAKIPHPSGRPQFRAQHAPTPTSAAGKAAQTAERGGLFGDGKRGDERVFPKSAANKKHASAREIYGAPVPGDGSFPHRGPPFSERNCRGPVLSPFPTQNSLHKIPAQL